MACLRCLVLSSAVIPAVHSLQASSGSDLRTGTNSTGLPIYIEVARPRGSEVGTIESQLLKKYSPGQNTFRLSEESRIAQDDAYKSLVMNTLGPQMDVKHDFCTKNVPCIQSFVRSPAFNTNMYAQLGKGYADMQSQGCLQLGGCKAEILGTLNWHMEQSHNLLVESGLMDASSVQERLTIINRNPSYQKILVVVANNYKELAAKHEDTAAMSTTIQSFLADPKGYAAPVLTNPRELSYGVQRFTCNMYQMLGCMTKESQGQRCDGTKFDGVYVIDRTQPNSEDKLAVAMKGCERNDQGLLEARAALTKSLPPGSTMCLPTHGMPTAQSLFKGFFR